VTIIRLAVRNLLRRPARTALLVLGVGLAVATAVALLALSHSIKRSTDESARERGADFTVSQKGAADLFGGFVAAGLEPAIAAVPGVVGISGELAMFAPVDEEFQFLVSGMAETSYFWPQMPLKAGRLPKRGERYVVLIGESVANALHKGVGDELRMFDHTLKIIGVTGYQTAVNRGLLIMPLRDLQELAFRADQVTVFHIALAPGLAADQVEAVKHKIAALGPVTVDPTDQLFDRDRNVEVLRAVSLAISIIALTTAGLSVLNVLLMAVQERTRETGIMMAIGWSDRRIMATIVLEGIVTGIAGCVVGVPLGFIACSFFNMLPVIGTYLSFHPSFGIVLPSVTGAFLLSVVGSLYPAWRAVSMTPADALRRA
jgi:putative ABC transport system permease protein